MACQCVCWIKGVENFYGWSRCLGWCFWVSRGIFGSVEVFFDDGIFGFGFVIDFDPRVWYLDQSWTLSGFQVIISVFQ